MKRLFMLSFIAFIQCTSSTKYWTRYPDRHCHSNNDCDVRMQCDWLLSICIEPIPAKNIE